MYDGRVGRWMTTDPYSQHHSPYLAMGNNPICRIDIDGGVDVDRVLKVGLGIVGVIGGVIEVNSGLKTSSTGIGAVVGGYLVVDGGSRIIGSSAMIYEGITGKEAPIAIKAFGGGVGRVGGRVIDSYSRGKLDEPIDLQPGPAESILGTLGDLFVIGRTLRTPKDGFNANPAPSGGWMFKAIYGASIGFPSGLINDIRNRFFFEKELDKSQSGLFQYQYQYQNYREAYITVLPGSYGDYKESDFDFR